MQINQIQPTTFGNRPMLKQMRRNLHIVGAVLSGIGWVAKDIFVPRKKLYIEIGGRKINERDLPDSVTGPSDQRGVQWGPVYFSKEDQAKLDKLSYKEYVKQSSKLLEAGKYSFCKPEE